MSNAAKGVLWTLSAYLVVVALVVWWMAGEFRATARELVQQSAQAAGGRLATALGDVSLGRLLDGDAAAHRRVAESLGRTDAGGETISAPLSVVDASGKIVASADANNLGVQSARPDELFSVNRAPRVSSRFSGPFDLGRHALQTPVIREGALVGYVQLDLNTPVVDGLFAAARRHLVVLALAGILAIAIAGVLLRPDSGRSGLVRAGRSAAPTHSRNTVVGRGPGAVHSEAGNTGAGLLEGAADRPERPPAVLDRVLDLFPSGVLLLKPEAEVLRCNGTARELVAEKWEGEATPILDEALRVPLARTLGDLARTGEPSGILDVESGVGERRRRLRFEIHPAGPAPAQAYIALVKDRDLLDALEDDLRTATRFRGLSVLYVGAAHDLRGPLNNMVVNLELLKQTLKSAGAHETPGADSANRQRKYIETIQQEIYRLNRYVQALLDLTAPDQARLDDLDLVQTLTEVAGLIRAQAKLQHVELDWQLPDSPVTLRCRRVPLTQVLLNLIINALEAMPEGGTLTVTLEGDDDEARVEVCDTGQGIPQALQGRIFDMHFTTKTGATGIGLHVARSVAREHGGEVGFRRRADGGTCFMVRLPLRPAGPPGA